MLVNFILKNSSVIFTCLSVKSKFYYSKNWWSLLQENTANFSYEKARIEALCKYVVAEISFVLLQTFELENKLQKVLSVKPVTFFLDFSKKFSLEFLKCSVENFYGDFFLMLLLKKESMSSGNHRLLMDYNFEELGFVYTGKNNEGILFGFSCQKISELNKTNVLEQFIELSTSMDRKYLMSTKVVSKMNTYSSI